MNAAKTTPQIAITKALKLSSAASKVLRCVFPGGYARALLYSKDVIAAKSAKLAPKAVGRPSRYMFPSRNTVIEGTTATMPTSTGIRASLAILRALRDAVCN